MKKFYVMMAAALVAFSFASCNKKGQNEPEPSKGDEPVAAFNIQVSDIEATTALVTVTPADTAATYYWEVFQAEGFDGLSDDSIYAALKYNIDYMIAYYEVYYGMELTYADFLSKGEEHYNYESLNPETDYVVLAVNMDEECNFSGAVVKKAFRTKEVVITDEVDLGALQGGGFEDYRSEDGSYIAYATDDATYDVTLNIYDEDFSGNYTEADLEGEYSYIWTAEMNSENALSIAKAELKNVPGNGDVATISGWVVATNGIKYKFSFTYPTVEESEAPKKVAAKKVALRKDVKGLKNFKFQK